MQSRKRFNRFILRRTPFWLFFLAGVSALTLLPLFDDPLVAAVGATLAIIVMTASAAARLRDMGCSAWYTPLVAIPLVALYAGVSAGDHQHARSTHVHSRLLGASVFSAALSLSWLVAASAQ